MNPHPPTKNPYLVASLLEKDQFTQEPKGKTTIFTFFEIVCSSKCELTHFLLLLFFPVQELSQGPCLSENKVRFINSLCNIYRYMFTFSNNMPHPLQDNAEAPVKELDIIAQRKHRIMDREMQIFPASAV